MGSRGLDSTVEKKRKKRGIERIFNPRADTYPWLCFPGPPIFPCLPLPPLGTRENRPKTRFLCRDRNTIMVCFVGRERPSLPSENRTEFFPSFRLSPRHRSVAKFPNIPLQIVSRFPSIRHFSRV